MKYSIIINQAGVIDAGLGEKTDLVDWAIIDYIMSWQSVPNASRVGQHVWINLKHLVKSMPLLGISTKSAISRRLTNLLELNLITKKQDDFGRLYVAISQFCHQIISFRAVAEIATPLPTEQQGVADGTTGCCFESNGVLPTEQHSVVNKLVVNPLVVNKDTWTPPDGLNLEAWAEFEEHRKSTKGKFSDLARTKAANAIINLSKDEQQSTIDRSIQANWAGLFPDKAKQGTAQDLSTQIYKEGSF